MISILFRERGRRERSPTRKWRDNTPIKNGVSQS